MKDKLVSRFIIGTFVSLYVLVSLISTIHVISFFELSNDRWLAITLAIAFEIGAAASLASLITLDKMNKFLVFTLFITLTLFQSMGNSYYAYVHLHDFQGWIELFGLQEEELIYQKRILSIISGGILPLVALGFIKSLVDYIKPSKEESVIEPVKTPIIDGPIGNNGPEDKLKETLVEEPQITETIDDKYSIKPEVEEEIKNDIKVFKEPLKKSEAISVDTSLQIKPLPRKNTSAK